MHATLGVIQAATTVTEWVGRLRLKPRPKTATFLEWSVDGTPLRQLIEERSDGTVAPPREEITRLLDGHADEALDQIDRLLGRVAAEFDDDRVALLVCPLCGDLGCGALTARLVIANETVEWRDLGWETSLHDGFMPFAPRLCISFDRRQYVEVLLAVRDQCRSPNSG